jgi:hypothetical protein
MPRNATKRRPVVTAKQRALAAVEKLPADATIEDAIERLVFLAKIERASPKSMAGRGMGHAEVKRRVLR